MSNIQLSVNTDLLVNGLVVEASAGTGKTYSVAALVTRQIALDGDLRIGEVLITTFTRNAAAELRDRVRSRFIDTSRQLRAGKADDGDELAEFLLQDGSAVALQRASRLNRATVEFDQATISTIHSVCTRVLRLAGVGLGAMGSEDITSQAIDEIVNDALVTRALASNQIGDIDPKRMVEVVAKLVGDPFIKPWFDDLSIDDDTKQYMLELQKMLEDCVDRVFDATKNQPSFSDLLRRAYQVVTDPARRVLRDAIRTRFKLAFVDEAQDTDTLQWEFFQQLFPPELDRPLVAVGDPKQAIYGFRGADVRAFVTYSKAATRRTLTVNHRSDMPLLSELNNALDGSTFGADISYVNVTASPKNIVSKLTGATPVEFIDAGEISQQSRLDIPVIAKISELLTVVEITRAGVKSKVQPRDICVLVRAKAVGRAIERKLKYFGIPAVSNGTESVMEGAMAGHIRSMLEAMAQITDVGRVRRVAGSPFFGKSLRNESDITEPEILIIQDRLSELKAILQRQGVAALSGAISSDPEVMVKLTAGTSGERNITDFAHVMDLLHGASDGFPCTATHVLELFVELLAVDPLGDLVSRRVESDVDAVQIMTIHSAKGLEFPCVVVADLWKAKAQKGPPVFYIALERVIDIGYMCDRLSDQGAVDDGESSRLLYVALTRAQHHLSVIVAAEKVAKNPPKAGAKPKSPNVLTSTIKNMPAMRQISTLPKPVQLKHLSAASAGTLLATAPSPGKVVQAYQRSSFSGLIDIHVARQRRDSFGSAGQGSDEQSVSELPSGQPAGDAESINPIIATTKMHKIPSSRGVGNIIHAIFENIDTTSTPLEDEVRRVVESLATSSLLRSHHVALNDMIIKSLRTPFGGVFGNLSFVDIAPADRLAEMDFEMAIALSPAGVLVSDIGRVLSDLLAPGDPLHEYAKLLTNSSFNIPLAGLINGSLDALLRLPESTPQQPVLVITDYKSNKLHAKESDHPLLAYAPDNLRKKMCEAHYILQALIYGTSVYRMVRWRAPQADHDACIKGIAYGFTRGMVGPDAPVDEHGHRYGVFTWSPPHGLFARLSDLFAGKRPK